MGTRRFTDDLDEDGESTSLDLGREGGGAAKPKPAEPSRKNAAAPRAPPAVDDEETDYLAERPSGPGSAATPSRHSREQDPDETDFMAERPSGQRLSLRASSPPSGEPEVRAARPRTRAVPLDTDALAVLRAAADPTRAPLPHTQPISADEAEEVTAPPEKRRRDVEEDSAPKSMPRVTRFFVAATPKKPLPPPPTTDATPTPAVDRARVNDAPRAPHRPLPARADLSATTGKPASAPATGANPFARERTITRSSAASGGSTGGNTAEADGAPADGMLVVEAPQGAVVFVDGEERGVGPSVRVEGLDRYARHAVRIQAPGFLRWSGTVTLAGRTAAKIRPALKKK